MRKLFLSIHLSFLNFNELIFSKKGAEKKPQIWHGMCYGECWGKIQTRLNGCGRGILDFGNCSKQRTSVEVLLNNQVIGVAFPDPLDRSRTLSKIIEFDFKDGDILQLREWNGAIMFNNFHVVNCGHHPQEEKSINFTLHL